MSDFEQWKTRLQEEKGITTVAQAVKEIKEIKLLLIEILEKLRTRNF